MYCFCINNNAKFTLCFLHVVCQRKQIQGWARSDIPKCLVNIWFNILLPDVMYLHIPTV